MRLIATVVGRCARVLMLAAIASGAAAAAVPAVADAAVYPLEVCDSVWDSTRDVIGPPSAGTFAESGDAHIAPLVADLAAGDLRPRGSSAAIDRDSKTSAQYVDLSGGPVADGDGDGIAAADAGAFEYRRRAPSIDAAGVPTSGTTGSSLPFTATASDPDGDAVQAVWSFGDGSIGSGTQTTHIYAVPGVYHPTLELIDEAGLRVTRTFTTVVTAWAAPAAGGATGATSGGGGAGAGVGAPRPDRVAPRITGLRLLPNPVDVRHAARVLLRLSVSEPAALRIVARPAGATRSRTIAVRVRAGRGSVAVGVALRRARVLRSGRWTLAITATDASGNRSPVRTLALIVRS